MTQIVDRISPHSFEATKASIVGAIERAGLKIFAQVDHSEAARSAGLGMSPTVVLLYGNPVVGTPIMLERPEAALELPLRVLIREDAARRVHVSFRPVRPAMAEAGVSLELSTTLEPAQRLISAALDA